MADEKSDKTLTGEERELQEAVDRVLGSTSRKKLVIAGPGAGKTTLFQKLLERAPGNRAKRLVLTFVNNLKEDLERSLGELAQVYTLHGYCQLLLHRHEKLRTGLSDFRCYPGLVSLIKQDWECLQASNAPAFVDLMRRMQMTEELDAFYTARANYYDAVDFDDSVYRTVQALKDSPELVPAYELVLIDEFQDFNAMEATVISLLAERNPIVVAGDDDQALYGQLRAASWDHIRSHHDDGEYEVFYLPFCLRCPEVIVVAVNDIIVKARENNKLDGRIDKPYRYFEPVKGDDSKRYPKIERVETSVQRQDANYFARFIEASIRAIPQAEIDQANAKHEPVALIIAAQPYRRQIENYLVEAGLLASDATSAIDERTEALKILREDPRSNLGWRIILALGKEVAVAECVREAARTGKQLVDCIPAAEQAAILKEAREWMDKQAADENPDAPAEEGKSHIKITSYEGSKGLSAQRVFIAGVHANEIPRNDREIQDIEICRFVVGLTRTKKQCTVLTTKRFGKDLKRPSLFLSWIDHARYTVIEVNAAYWGKG